MIDDKFILHNSEVLIKKIATDPGRMRVITDDAPDCFTAAV
jgi:hypothetical protein